MKVWTTGQPKYARRFMGALAPPARVLGMSKLGWRRAAAVWACPSLVGGVYKRPGHIQAWLAACTSVLGISKLGWRRAAAAVWACPSLVGGVYKRPGHVHAWLAACTCILGMYTLGWRRTSQQPPEVLAWLARCQPAAWACPNLVGTAYAGGRRSFIAIALPATLPWSWCLSICVAAGGRGADK